MTRTIQAKLVQCNEQAKVFNNREMLVGLGDTDYTQVQIMTKEF